MVAQREQLIPERLRVDREARPRHLPHLAGEGQVIDVLRHRHADREVHGVPPARDELRRARRRDDARAAPAAVLLAAVAHDAEAPLDDVDLLGLLVLVLPDVQDPAALRTGGRLLGPRVHHLDERERRLRARAVTPRRRGRRRRLGPRATPPPLRGRREERAGPGRELLL